MEVCSGRGIEVNIVMLGYDELLTIYKYISLHFTASQIARKLNIAPSTLYRVVKSNLQIKKRNTYSLQFHFRDCKFVPECKKKLSRCPTECSKYRQYLCEKITRFPFFCDFCDSQTYCTKERHYWNPVLVYQHRLERLKETRSHLSLPTPKLHAFGDWLAPYVKRKLSLEVVQHQFPEAFPVSTSTVRRWIDKGCLSVRRIDLLRAVSFKTKKAYGLRRPSSANPLLKFGHTYPYFLDDVKAHPETSIIEMDTVHGLASETCKLLTFFHRQSHLQFAVLIPNLSPVSVTRVLRTLQTLLGPMFSALFEVILADNGIEFDDLISAAVQSDTGEILSRVYYTRPYRSGDKGGCERNHELFRYLVPKGHKLSDFNQKDIDFMFSMINSYPRESLSWKTPIDVFRQFFPNEILDLLAQKKVPLENVSLKH
jgi:transposase, IS30 family